MKRRTFLSLMGAAVLTSGMMFTGCGAGSDGDDRKIVRIGHVQSQTHPDHLGLEAFANYINEKLGDKYRVEVYPSELLGSQTEMVQLAKTQEDFENLCRPYGCQKVVLTSGENGYGIPELQAVLNAAVAAGEQEAE